MVFKEAFGALHQQEQLLHQFSLEQKALNPAEHNKLICCQAWHWYKIGCKGNLIKYYLQRDWKFIKVLLKAQQKWTNFWRHSSLKCFCLVSRYIPRSETHFSQKKKKDIWWAFISLKTWNWSILGCHVNIWNKMITILPFFFLQENLIYQYSPPSTCLQPCPTRLLSVA